MRPLVSIVKYTNVASVLKAIELCEGFNGIKPMHRVLLKPNICTVGAGFLPPFGTVTTTNVIEGTILALKEHGIDKISIGEGTVLDELGTNTMKGYKWIQYDKLAKRYGVELIDFNAGPYSKVMSEDVPIEVAEAALETDFFINVPVLKTHTDTRVSLASKNLKGCMSMKSKKYFHGEAGTLHYHISRLMEVVPQHLTIIDGIYAMERGPDPTVGTGYPKGIVVASTDFLAADAVGARLLGGEPIEVEHLRLFAERNGRMDVLQDREKVEIRGERLDEHAEFLPWQHMQGRDMDAAGHKGFDLRLISNTMCSGCYGNLTGPTLLLASLSRNKNFNDFRIVAGKSLKDDRNSPRTLLFGNCAIKENKHLDQSTKFEGCPPKFYDSLFLLANQMPSLFDRIAFYTRLGFYFVRASMGIGILPLPRFSIYKKSPNYDMNHFRVQRERR
jgi:uncharacterized protein (DUF362 family)